MNLMNVCLKLSADVESAQDHVLLEKNYQTVFKPLLSFLYSHPNFLLAVEFTGIQLNHYSKKHPESIELLRELISRKQIELIGGGYYAPVFPLLLPMDRSGQIEKMNTALRSAFGKRPSGLSLFGSIWDPSLVTAFQFCGMNYVFLDSTLISKKNTKFVPLIASEQGRSVKVLTAFKDLIPNPEEKGEDWTARIKKFINKKLTSAEKEDTEYTPFVTIPFSLEQFSTFMKSECFGFISHSFEEESTNSRGFEFILPSAYLKNAKKFIKTYIPAGMEWEIARWASQAFVQTENDSHFPLTIHDFLNEYTQNRRLYERMMHVSMLISQCKGVDKMRKMSASESLWQAQCGFNYVSLPFGVPAVSEKRQNAYKLLNEAEKFIREGSKSFKESLTSYDYNGDGLCEYVAKMEKYGCVLSLNGGQISELNVIDGGSNYASSLSRYEQFDSIKDGYTRGFFVDHLGEEWELKDYISNKKIATPIFSHIQFAEQKFIGKRKELHLEGCGKFSSLEIPVSIRKNYTFTSSGISVQYILKNESPIELKGFFAVELNFAQTRFDKDFKKGSQYSAEIILDGTKSEIDCTKNFNAPDKVSFLQIKDSADKKMFIIEPNEESGITCSMLHFKRPVTVNETQESASTLTASLYWKIDLAAGMEKEKTINLSIVNLKVKR